MTAKAALGKALLDGRTINVRNCFTLIGLTNASRECSRMIEKPFEIRLERTRREGTSSYGQNTTWIDFRLLHTEQNKEGIKKLRDYIREQSGEEIKLKYSKGQKEELNRKIQKEIQQNLFL